MENFVILGCDFDGSLNDMSKWNKIEGQKYFKKEIMFPNAYSAKEIFDVSDKEEFKFGLKKYRNYCVDCEPYKEAFDTLKIIKKECKGIHANTARKFSAQNDILGVYVRYLVKKWVVKFGKGFEFDSYQFSNEKTAPEEKLAICTRLGINIDIDDKPDVAIKLAENGIIVLLVDAPYNQDIKDHPNIRRVTWDGKKAPRLIDVFREESKKINNDRSYGYKNAFGDSVESKEIISCLNERSRLRKIEINEKEFKKGERRFKVIRSLSYLPANLIFKPKIIGKENIPYENGYIIASNHINNYDQYIISLALGNKAFYGYAASKIQNTCRGKLFKFTKGAVFIEKDSDNVQQKREAEEELASILSKDKIGVIFPEGTRKNSTEEGRKKISNPHKIGTVKMAYKTGLTIIPTSIDYQKGQTVIRFDKPVFVNPGQDLLQAKNEVESKVLKLTMQSKGEK